MHDPCTVAFDIRYPWRKWGRRGKTKWEREYRDHFITVWHVDPKTDGSDDSCGWFIRGRHLSPSDKALADRLITNEYDNIRNWFPGCDADEAVSRVKAIFAALRREERPWYREPRWHFWHWKLQVHPLQKLWRWLFLRCDKCGKRFGWNETPIGTWGGDRHWHGGCQEQPKPVVPDALTGTFHQTTPRPPKPQTHAGTGSLNA